MGGCYRTVSELDRAFVKKLSKIPLKDFASTSSNLRRSMEDASAYVHYLTSGFEAMRRAFGAIPASLQPDEEQFSGPRQRERHMDFFVLFN